MESNISETAPVLVWPVTVKRAVVWLPLSAILAMSGCADRVITLSYTPPPASSTVSPRLTVFRLADQRGNEGDHADPLRVGGIYGGYGNRLAKVMVTQPWPPRLLSALVAEFRGAGVDAVGTDQLPLNPPVDRAWLEGDLRNFSTESRWGRRAHISAIVRLRVPGGGIVVEKEIKDAQAQHTKLAAQASALGPPRERADRDFRKQTIMTIRTLLLENALTSFMAVLVGTLTVKVSLDCLLHILFERSGARMETNSQMIYWINTTGLSAAYQRLLTAVVDGLCAMDLRDQDIPIRVRLKGLSP